MYVVCGVVLVDGQSVTDSTAMNSEQDSRTSVATTCGVSRLQSCIQPLTSYLKQSSVDELHVLFPVYSQHVLDSVCRSVTIHDEHVHVVRVKPNEKLLFCLPANLCVTSYYCDSGVVSPLTTIS